MQNDKKSLLMDILDIEKMNKASREIEKVLRCADMTNLEATFTLLSFCVQFVDKKNDLLKCVEVTWESKERTYG